MAGILLLAIRRRQILRRATVSNPPTSPLEPPTPAQWFSNRSEDVRQSLADRLGPAWNSLTTEEIAAHPNLSNDPTANRLLAFLQAADQSKFADPASTAHSLEDWESWINAYLASKRLTP